MSRRRRPSAPSDAPAQSPQVTDAVVTSVYLALAHSNWLQAMHIVEDHWAPLVQHRVEVVRAVADALPPEVLRVHPRWATVRRRLSLPLAMRGDAAPSEAAASGDLEMLVDLTRRSVTARRAGRTAAAAGWALLARERFESIAPSDRGALIEAAPKLILQWALSMVQEAEEAESRRTLKLAFAWANVAGNGAVAASAAGTLAWLHAFAGRSRAADAWIDRALQLRAASQTTTPSAQLQLAIALRCNDMLDHEGLLEALLPLEQRVDDDNHSVVVGTRAAMYAQRQGSDPAGSLAEIGQHMSDQQPARLDARLNFEVLSMTRAVLLMLSGAPLMALRALDPLLQETSRPWTSARRAAVHLVLGDLNAAEIDASTMYEDMREWPRFSIESLAVRAAVQLRRGATAYAGRLFADAVALADIHRLPIALSMLTQTDFDALVALLESDVASASLRALDSIGVSRPRAPSVRANPTPRELHVLRALADHPAARMPALAETIGVSENTLKTHLRSLYSKAAVSGRTQLLAVAQQVGWL